MQKTAPASRSSKSVLWFGGTGAGRVFVCVFLAASTLAAPPGARPGSGRISIFTQPAGAAVYVDGHPSGKTPATVEGLGPGRYFVRVEMDGYRAGESVVEISSGQNSPSLSLDLTSNSAPPRTEAAPALVAPAAPVPLAPSTPAPLRVEPPAPNPPAATPSPRATPTPIPSVPSPAPAPAPGSDEDILELVAAHLKSISDGDIDAFLRLCASKVDWYDEGMQSRESIRRSRKNLKERWPVYEIANVREVTVRPGEKADVKRAAVSYDWNVSNPKTGKKASGTASDVLDFKQVDGQWLIVRARQNVERRKSGG